ncbi:hypothetical protein TTHERM_00218340 (macronuclear) [Tetrahymena thermophila SB210]|uniref:Uncharacterized protein n=1 Tax=Tetrahymena thermophila (strain SB210) TaxID=312017 RepID=I7LVX0_TETTS|nr:hypothetical protein TTHERM_00218340 [Tetrahymena thermophila SB210]8GYM_6L Chain 6L, Decapping nuclease [Tetrahymena thermophila SB210]8GYM_6l Chain 6l, Decapping nuclease [Tetrahymena thermophila SB210]8GZU_33 Chain 33, Decapping nuclease [Tetrahymena thermophila SB210]8GZU_6L Chain 6L, Decapping nuclease [Tetrahymena thermophila SB210]8GZU_6l Chain 6l, Decapping nuclease [Tetrahymena thermophila SB210]8GZU_88 Chain 88, Decapping nuclease [Tetrahymena thermophila SB210]EAS00261.2 hypoth|eukprot:XP_001020506.2 hypothetical protein TTHERM_00218340 [Tetrahymena thermophila SB210]
MEVKYRGPSDDKLECEFLENNLLSCLREKSVQDNVAKMTCRPEFLVWFFLECPTKAAVYHDPKGLRNIFIQDKIKQKGSDDGVLSKDD